MDRHRGIASARAAGLFVLALAASCAPSSFAAEVRGKIVAESPNSPRVFPAGGVKLELYRYSGGGTGKPVATTVSSQDGMYYFRNLDTGAYYIRTSGGTYTFKVDKQQQDLAPITVRR